jgi:hypothetical protein
MIGRALLLRKVLWPQRIPPSGIIGGGAALLGDFSNLLSDKVTPAVLLSIFGAATAVFGLLCIQRALLLIPAEEGPALDEVAHCAVCDGLRIALAGTAVFLVLMIVGHGDSATEVIGKRLGLIQQEVHATAKDVGEIHDVVQPQMIIKRPSTPAERFNNAWVHMNIRRDPAQAWAAAQDLYAHGAPRKVDAAELYFNTGRQFVAREQLLAQMASLGRSQRDATLLVIAGRNTTDDAASDRLYAEARGIDPDLPIAQWDVIRQGVRMGRFEGSFEAQRRALMGQKAAMEAFLAKLDASPPSKYYFIPQYQPDYAVSVRQMLTAVDRNIGIYSRIPRSERR